MAMLFGALLILGVSPGPQLVEQHPDVFWGVINSMYIGNILLLIMSIPLVGLFVRILRVRPAILAPDHRADHAARRLHDQQLDVRHLPDGGRSASSAT